MVHAEYDIQKGAYNSAGEASADIKRKLQQLGISPVTLRRVAVSSYEMEMNIIIHSLGGTMGLCVDKDWITLSSKDQGPGIEDVELAMSEGYSTADDDARSMGFGAGMGLPNMKRNADDFRITSQLGEGTQITITFKVM
jgi:anti-sigma regulatory factor (Ser/Thr protein kinase)